MSSSKTVYIIIPVLNHWEQTKTCLDSLRASIYNDIVIIVVDHGSTDNTKKTIGADYPEVRYITDSIDKWWAGATNRGINLALEQDAKLIMLLNNDCSIASNTISSLVNHHYSQKEAIIAPVQVNKNNSRKITNTTTCFLLGFPTLIVPHISAFSSDATGLKKTGLIIGGRGVLIPGIVFNKVGLLDDAHLPHYGADHDFYLRCKKSGIPLFIDTRSLVYVDEKRTGIAGGKYTSLKQITRVIKNRRSHLNIKDLSALYKRHYPVRMLFPIGVFLNLVRHFSIFFLSVPIRLVYQLFYKQR